MNVYVLYIGHIHYYKNYLYRLEKKLKGGFSVSNFVKRHILGAQKPFLEAPIFIIIETVLLKSAFQNSF
jgi:hypothetical protein